MIILKSFYKNNNDSSNFSRDLSEISSDMLSKCFDLNLSTTYINQLKPETKSKQRNGKCNTKNKNGKIINIIMKKERS